MKAVSERSGRGIVRLQYYFLSGRVSGTRVAVDAVPLCRPAPAKMHVVFPMLISKTHLLLFDHGFVGGGLEEMWQMPS